MCPSYPSRNVIGGIDGSHIKIPGPEEDLLLAYYNYKKFYSITLLAIVDNRGLFRWFTSGAAGSCGDSGVLQATSLYKRAQAELTKPAKERNIFADGSCILGDSAFSEGPWLRTPFTLPSSRVERYFNYKHSSMRMRVEHAFGRWVHTLKARWSLFFLRRGFMHPRILTPPTELTGKKNRGFFVCGACRTDVLFRVKYGGSTG